MSNEHIRWWKYTTKINKIQYKLDLSYKDKYPPRKQTQTFQVWSWPLIHNDIHPIVNRILHHDYYGSKDTGYIDIYRNGAKVRISPRPSTPKSIEVFLGSLSKCKEAPLFVKMKRNNRVETAQNFEFNLDLWTKKSIEVFLGLRPIHVWSTITVYQNEIWSYRTEITVPLTDGRTDRLSLFKDSLARDTFNTLYGKLW